MKASARERSAILVSACLTGICCRHDGTNRLDENVIRLSEEVELVPLCPEENGGLSIPRQPSEIIGGDGEDVLDGAAKIIDGDGRDVTAQFLRGSKECLMTARKEKIKKAIMKDKSPSCGSSRIYRNGILVEGKGVFTALLIREGIEVISNEEI